MKISTAFVLLSILVISTIACSSNGKSTADGAADAAGKDAKAGDTAGNDTAGSDTADGAISDTGDSATTSDTGDTAADGKADASSGPCTTDLLMPDAGSIACAQTYQAQLNMMRPGTTAQATGMCAGYLAWANESMMPTRALCLYDPATKQLVGAMLVEGTTIACFAAGTMVPLVCADPASYRPDAGTDGAPGDVRDGAAGDAGDAWVDAPPDPALEASLKNGLLGLWPLDGDGKDRSGHGLDLTITGLSFYASARFGSGLEFKGDINQTASRPMSDPSLLIGRSDYTVSVWVSVDPTKDGPQGILDDGAQAGGGGWGLGSPMPSGGWIFATGSGTFCCTGGEPGFGWRHLVAERSGSTITVYSGATTVGTVQASDPDAGIANETFRLGTWFGGKGDPLFGVVDDVAIWNRALTAAERSYLDQHAVPPAP